MKCKQIGYIEQKFKSTGRVYDMKGSCPTLCTNQGGNTEIKFMDSKTKKLRRITPRESWRMMGFTDSDFDKAQAVNSNTQLYKQAGNSIVVNVIEAILKELLCD